jgi:hypothetical protein
MKKIRVVSVILLAVIVLLGAATMEALPQNAWETYYYDDANHSEQVGYERRECNGWLYREGEQTNYYDNYSWTCGGEPQWCTNLWCVYDPIFDRVFCEESWCDQ